MSLYFTTLNATSIKNFSTILNQANRLESTLAMPSLQKFHANVARHVNLMDKNICANLIRNEYVVTTRTKAKRAQAKIETFLAQSLKENKTIKEQNTVKRVLKNRSLNYLQPPDKMEVGTKVINELSKRYPLRKTGFTRIIKLEPRLGNDKAPMSVIELVDSGFEFKWWYTAKIVARLELQGITLDDLTTHNVEKLTNFRENGEEEFRKAVSIAKETFFKANPETGEITDESVLANLENKPENLEYYGGNLAGTTLVSKKYKTKSRTNQENIELPKSPFLE